MADPELPMPLPTRLLAWAAGALLLALAARPCAAQTPSPLADWQYSAGEVLASMGGPLPDWRVVLGMGASLEPEYMGSKRYRVDPAPLIDLRYKDLAFVSDGEGIGVNLLHGTGYRAGIALAYDLGRNTHDDPRLQHFQNIGPALEPKLFAQYFLKVVVLTADLRKAIGGNDGLIGDVGAYVPLPVAKDTFLFIGPSATFADRRYMQAYFGVDPPRAAASGLRRFAAGAGPQSFSFGATGVYLMGDHWLFNVDGAYQRLLGDAADSPLPATRSQFTMDFVIGYRF